MMGGGRSLMGSVMMGYPFVCVSIGLAINKEIQVGVVYNSVLNEMYTAIKGKGAFLNDKKISSSKERELARSLIITELGSNRKKERLDIVMKNLRTIAEEPDAAHGIRIGGSAAYNLCTIARGGADGYFQFGIHVWDIAAGILIVTEAGGVVIDPRGECIKQLSSENGPQRMALREWPLENGPENGPQRMAFREWP
ncbi:hypothetical protein QZH41_008201 [Actinostola sp. cb2023]|nr:hypothetical protein QZH41_008201 [Actinostola sp. cb2023]